MIGKTLSHFKILAEIDEGGMGVVYRAEDEKLRRPVAVKVLRPELVDNEERRLRFLREARTAAAINHPNIATIYEVDEADGVVFIAMELVEGKTLREVMGGKPMSIKDALRVATEMSEGLAKAHQSNVVHRDLKPENVKITADGHVKILDFGLAKPLQVQSAESAAELSKLQTISREMTREGKIFGTAAYMSPEQARGQTVDARSDLFSFGTTLYEMVTGKVPFHGKTDMDTLSSIIKDEPTPPSQHNSDLPPKLEEIINECLEKDPGDRYLHTDQLAADLRKLKRATDSGVQAIRTPSGPVTAAPTGPLRVVRWVKRHPYLVAALGVALIVAAVGTWWTTRPAGGFKSGDQIIVADFQNTTDHPEYDSAIRDAFEDMFTASTFLDIIRGERLENLVGGQPGRGGTKLGEEEAHRLCAEGACAGFLIGTIEPEGSEYRLEARLHVRGAEEPALVRTVTVAGDDDVLKAIHDIVLDLRRHVGEAPQAVSALSPPTTRSLLAYQSFAIANRVGFDKPEEQISLFERALSLDPDFVEAYSYLAVAHANLGDYLKYRKYVEEAYQRSEGLEGLTEQERLWLQIYLLSAIYDYEKEARQLKALLKLYPFDRDAPNWLDVIYSSIYEDYQSAEEYSRIAYRLNPNGVTFSNLCENLGAQLKADDIHELAADYRKKGGNEQEISGCELRAAWAEAGSTSEYLEAVETLNAAEKLSKLEAIGQRGRAYLDLGRLAEAERLVPELWRGAVESRNMAVQFFIGIRQAWLEKKRSGRQPIFTSDHLKAVRSNLEFLRNLALFSVEMELAEPLAEITREHEVIHKDSESIFVREELQFAHGCLALIRDDAEEARNLLEPLARASTIGRRHHVLARVYEALGLWREAAAEYEDLLKNPKLRPFFPPFWHLDRFRLAHAYDRLDDTDRARQWYERFTADWKDADPDIPELIEARERLAELQAGEAAAE
jgi:tRNA A-37 threonylcarbamoyl transferase component Bud32/tetratricopeptide (TPR) repeat protein